MIIYIIKNDYTGFPTDQGWAVWGIQHVHVLHKSIVLRYNVFHLATEALG